MLASVHVADVRIPAALRFVLRPPRAGSVRGLRHADVAICAPLSGSVGPPRQLGRVGLVAFWDDEPALDAFLAAHRSAAALADGWHARLEPLRRHGSWPGVDDAVPTARATEYDGPAIVLTLARLRLSEAPRFLRTSARAEGRVLTAPGMVWATGMARPPFVATCSLWESTRALTTYAYGRAEPEHDDAIAEDRRRGFHHRSAFVRFRPLRVQGHLDGKNPLPQNWAATSSGG